MAQCPNCNKKLHFWNLKAECPHCHANIPNHDWENRLEQDAREREAAFYKMHSNINKLKFSVLGNTVRILRFVCAFLPILGYVVPLGSINLTCDDGTVFSAGTINMIAFFTKDTLKFGDIISKITGGFDLHSKFQLSFILLMASLLFGVIAFFAVLVIFGKFKQPVTLIMHVLSIATYSAAAVVYNKIGGDLASLSWGIFVGIALFVIAFVLDIIVLAKPVGELDGKYIPKDDELQVEYAKSIGALYAEPDKE